MSLRNVPSDLENKMARQGWGKGKGEGGATELDWEGMGVCGNTAMMDCLQARRIVLHKRPHAGIANVPSQTSS